MPAVCPTELLRLHTDDDGLIWRGDDATLAHNSYLDRDDFLHDLDLDGVRAVRVLGTAANAAMIVQLYQHRCGKTKVQLVRPSVCPTLLLAQPEAVLQHLWRPEVAGLPWASHVMAEEDYTAYAMIAAVREAGGCFGDLARNLLYYHPAWPALSFVPCLDEAAACALLCAIVDPRWFGHALHPGRLSKLLVYLGLTPQNMAAFVRGSAPGRHYERSLLSLRVWYSDRSMHAQRGDDARFAWLWQCFDAHSPKAFLACTRRLLYLVCAVWLAALHKHPETVFLPARFFRQEADAQAYTAHRAQCH